MWRGEGRFLRPWAIGGSIWLVLSLLLLSEYKRVSGGQHVIEIWFLLSLLWAEFGFAGVYHCLRRRRGRGLGALVLVLLIPPLLLFLLVTGSQV